jgi:hypothetical protein
LDRVWSAAPGARPAPLQATADEQGRYRIAGIPAGDYRVNLRPDEYLIVGGLPYQMRGKLVSVAPGEKLEPFDIALKREGVITGRVTDASGRPLARQEIELTRIGDDGKPQPSPFNHSNGMVTDDQGVYRITLLPEGRYLVSAGITLSERNFAPIPGKVFYPQTYHPDVSDLSKARAVEVGEGAETAGVDIQIAGPLKTYDIKGRVVNGATGKPAEGIEISYSLRREDDRVLAPRSQGARSNAEGEFLLQGLLPGKYLLFPQFNAAKEYFSEPAQCEITGGGVDGVEVTLQPGASVSGTVDLEGLGDPAIRSKLSQSFIGGYNKDRRADVLPRMPERINPDGSFRVKGLRPGKTYFSLSRDPNSAGFTVKRVERDGTVLSDGLEIGPGENLSNIRVVVGYGNLTLRGEVKVVGGALPPHIGIYVNLNRINESGGTLGAFVDTRGQFTYTNLSPGEYEIHLVTTNFQPGEPRDTALSKLIFNTRQKVTLAESANGTGQATVTLVIDLSQKEGN